MSAQSGGPERCPRPCSECTEGTHHMSDAMIGMAGDSADEEHEGGVHPAELAGCEAWYECKHCPAWREYIDGDDFDEEPAS
jgi:hypothetical protein